MKVFRIIILVLAVAFIAIQFIPSGIPENEPADEKSIENSNIAPEPVLAMLKKSCFDCHSNQVDFPWYSKIAPSSWLLARHVNEGREYLNFSLWEDYNRREKIGLLETIKDVVESEAMPLASYLVMHRDAKLDADARSTIVDWADNASAKLLDGE